MATILMVIRPGTGGAFGHVLRLSDALVDRGHRVLIAGPHGRQRERTVAEIVEVEIPREASPVESLRAVSALVEIVRTVRPHVVHAHGSQGPAHARIARIRTPRVPLVVSPHNFAFDNYFASRAERAAYRGVEQALAPLATLFLCVCEAERRLATKLVSRRRTRVVHNGIDPAGYASADAAAVEHLRRTVGARGPILATVTELHPRKGLPTLLDAMKDVAARIPSCVLLIAGSGPTRDDVERRVGELGLEEHVVLLGHVDDPAAVYSAADAFVLPSWSESFPYALLEAMAAALPIVATDVGGVREAIEDGATGRLVAPQDPSALAAALIDVLGDLEVARGLGGAARERLGALFTFDAMVEGTLGVYAELGAR